GSGANAGSSANAGPADVAGNQTPVPFVDVTVELPTVGTSTRALHGVTARTDERGMAEFTFLGGDGVMVLGEAAIGGHGQATLRAERAITMSIVTKPRVFATGRVIDRSNVGVLFADLVLLQWPFEDQDRPHRDPHRGKLLRVGRSNRDGSFQIALGCGGRIGASHEDYASSAMYLLRPMRQRDGTPPTQVFELVLHRDPAVLTGTVRDSDGHLVAGAKVEVRSIMAAPADAELVAHPVRARTDATGTFRIAGLPSGDVHWSTTAANCCWHEGRTRIDHQNQQLHIELPLPASIEGVVVDKVHGTPIANATVSCGTAGSLCYQATKSADDGSYRLTDLGSGPTEVRAKFQQQQAATRVQLLPEYVASWRAELAMPSTGLVLTGLVRNAQNQPLSDWMVVVRQKGLDPIGVASSQDGRFAIPVRLASGLDVRCYAPGRQPTSFADAMQRNAVVGQEVTLVVTPHETTSITGRIVANQATGVPATIGCWHHERREYARYTADGDGQFVIADAPVGTVNLT